MSQVLDFACVELNSHSFDFSFDLSSLYRKLSYKQRSRPKVFKKELPAVWYIPKFGFSKGIVKSGLLE